MRAIYPDPRFRRGYVPSIRIGGFRFSRSATGLIRTAGERLFSMGPTSLCSAPSSAIGGTAVTGATGWAGTRETGRPATDIV